MKTLLIRLCFSIAMIALLSSCSVFSKKNACPNGDVVFVGDVDDIDVVSVSCVPRDGVLRVIVELLNDSDEERSIAYRFDWYDKDELVIGKEESWKPLFLYPKEVKTLRATAPNWLAVDTKLSIKQ